MPSSGDGTLWDLNALSLVGLPANFVLVEAWGIDDAGDIAGWGIDTVSGKCASLLAWRLRA